MLIPVHDHNPVRRTPVVTYALIVLNVVIFLVSPLSGFGGNGYSSPEARVCAENRYYYEYGAVPRELVGGGPIVAPPAVVSTDRGPVHCRVKPDKDKIPALSVLFAMFMHGGWMHLIGNMLYLYVFGNNVEDRMGHGHFALFYLAAGYLATYGFALLNPGSVQPLVGASGAIAAVLGAYLYLYPKARVTSLVPLLLFLPLRFPAWAVLGFYFVLQWLYFQGLGVSGDANVAYSAHLVGFAAGFVYAWALYRGRPVPYPDGSRAREPLQRVEPHVHTLPPAPVIPPPATLPPRTPPSAPPP
ncbi:rhomboid family intramembrane serine protease [Yinghuangia seranimata]|uniref:rhomboid family intramembrane serine protease n=1 Tax=Yinghuangia seranimata TaxID=408067 RepID=UPI00248C660C|nr:rhomboid family intramembrane serine protease [Yinghuangia seranimata]MDI2126111.1 rhomboid family intramembrane serine protease [Yinghuangia seranimata]